ncbi:PH domain-containing protein [Streptomyces sp. NPDC059373]
MTAGIQLLALGGIGGAEGAPRALRPWLYGGIGLAWAWLSWRAVTMRIRVSPEGIRSRGFWRTRFVAWEDLVEVESEVDLSRRGPLWEHPTAILFDGSRVPLTGVYGLRSEGTSRVDRIAERLNLLCDEA